MINWKYRRRVTWLSILYSLSIVTYLTLYGTGDNELQMSIVTNLLILVATIIGGYVFGMVADSYINGDIGEERGEKYTYKKDYRNDRRGSTTSDDGVPTTWGAPSGYDSPNDRYVSKDNVRSDVLSNEDTNYGRGQDRYEAESTAPARRSSDIGKDTKYGTWNGRRKILFICLIWCACMVAYLVFEGDDTQLNRVIATGSVLLAGASITSYLFGVVLDTKAINSSIGKSQRSSNYNEYPRY